MRRFVLFAAAAALALATGTHASAQLFGPKRPPAQQQQQPTDMAATCAQLKAMPNSPMTYDQCIQMAASQQAMQAAQNDPSAMRPGDEAMTCDQIKAEFAANGGLNVDKTQVAQAQTAGQNLIAANNQVEADARAMQAREIGDRCRRRGRRHDAVRGARRRGRAGAERRRPGSPERGGEAEAGSRSAAGDGRHHEHDQQHRRADAGQPAPGPAGVPGASRRTAASRLARRRLRRHGGDGVELGPVEVAIDNRAIVPELHYAVAGFRHRPARAAGGAGIASLGERHPVGVRRLRAITSSAGVAAETWKASVSRWPSSAGRRTRSRSLRRGAHPSRSGAGPRARRRSSRRRQALPLLRRSARAR